MRKPPDPRKVYKGLAKVPAKGGTVYYYAWRGGPRVIGEPFSPQFHASFMEAHANRRTPDDGRFRSVVIHYKAHEFPKLAPSTQKQWGPWLDRIVDHFGDLRIGQFDRADKIRPLIRQWRNRYADKPRSADMGKQVLSVVLAHAVDPMGKIASNPCEGIANLYSVDRSEKIWTDPDIARIKASSSAEIGFVVDLAAATGLRLGDLLRLSWSHVGEDAIVIVTGKSRKRRREAMIPLYDELRTLLGRIPRRSPVILTNSRGQPWTTDGFGSSFNKAKIKASMKSDDDLNFHDLRGTAATRFYREELSERVIAEIMGWEEEHVAKIIRRYVGRHAATRAAIIQLNARRT